jgi:hypothetical protein
MSLLVPWFLMAAGAAAAVAVVLHFLAAREPKAVPLPTARFAPDRPGPSRAHATRPRDLVLLAVRLALLLAVGAALAEPVLSGRRTVGRILLVDRSRAVRDGAELADNVRRRYAPGGAILLFDSSAIVLRGTVEDSLRRIAPTATAGNLSAALISAMRLASLMRATVDSVELVLFSPLVAEEVDAATDSIRALWPGAIGVVRVAARAACPAPGADCPRGVSIRAAPNDPLRVALPPALDDATATVRLVRGALTPADSAWARAGGGALVHWPPVIAAAAGAATPAGSPWMARPAADTAGAVVAGDAVVVAPFQRLVAVRDAESPAPRSAMRCPPATIGCRVSSRWLDGEPAALEVSLGAGCLRTVTVPVASRGDLVLDPRFARFAIALLGPCGGPADLTPLSAARVDSLAGAARPRLAATAAMGRPASGMSPLARWLLLAAVLLAAAEMLVRRRPAVPAGDDQA